MEVPIRRPRVAQAQTRGPAPQAAPAAPLRRAQRAPINPAPEPAASQEDRAPVRGQRVGQREVSASTHHRRTTISETNHTDMLPTVDLGPGPYGEVRIGHGRTINIGDFNSVRIEVHVTLPCTEATLDATMERAHDYVVEGFAAEEEYMLGRSTARRGNRRG